MSQIELQVTGFLVTVVREYHFQLLMALQTSGREGGSTAASPHAKARSKNLSVQMAIGFHFCQRLACSVFCHHFYMSFAECFGQTSWNI